MVTYNGTSYTPRAFLLRYGGDIGAKALWAVEHWQEMGLPYVPGLYNACQEVLVKLDKDAAMVREALIPDTLV